MLFCGVALLILLQLVNTITNGQQLPREIESGPNGNIVITLGGISDPSNTRPSNALLRLRARARGVSAHKIEKTSSTQRIEKTPSTIDATEYDYDEYNAQKAEMRNEEKGRVWKTKKQRRPASTRPTLLQFLHELLGGEKVKNDSGNIEDRNGRKVNVERTLSTGKAFGANLQLFDEQDAEDAKSGQRHPLILSTPTAANNQRPFLLNVDLPSHDAFLSSAPTNNAASIGRTLLAKTSRERLSINQGCKSWKDFQWLTNARRPKLVEGRVQKTVESTEPLNSKTFESSQSSQSSLAILGPVNNSVNELPLPECFLNQLGMVCCNRVLEDLIFRANDAMINANVNTCNIEIFSELLKNIVEKQFQRTFEIIVANGDFAAKIRFKDNLLCKTIANNKFVLIYATPEPYALSSYNVEAPLIS